MRPVRTAPYALASREDLDETVRLVEAAGAKILARVADVRDLSALTAVADEGVAVFGRLDIILANAGISTSGSIAEMEPEVWQEMIDINLTGVWNTVRAAVGHIVEGGRGGSIVLTSSTAGLVSMNNIGHYVAAKHGVTGLAKSLANELAKHRIRVNSLHPSNCNTPMLMSEFGLFRPDLESPGLDDVRPVMVGMHLLEEPWVEPEDVSNAVLFLVSDEGRFVTGSQFTVDLGFLAKS